MHSKPRGGDVTSKCKDALPKKSEHASLPTCGREKKASVSIVGPKPAFLPRAANRGLNTLSFSVFWRIIKVWLLRWNPGTNIFFLLKIGHIGR